LTEEAHHLSVGELGVERILRRAAQLERQGDPRKLGGIDVPTVLKWIRYWFSYSIDLFGSEVSSNAAEFFASGLKGRWNEAKDFSEHSGLNQSYSLPVVKDGKVVMEEVPLRNAMNEVLRQSYIKDSERVAKRWNAALEEEGSSFRVQLPNSRFFRRQGIYSDHFFDLEGNLISESEWNRRKAEWLPTEDDRQYVASLMQPVLEPGKVANWIAPPKKGLNNQPTDYEYVRL
jgi:benzoyl-CoA 2,3-dioxygenase component B